MILTRLTLKSISFPLSFKTLYSYSLQDIHDPFKILSVDKLLKLSASKKYQCPNQIQFYTTILNSLIKRGPEMDFHRSSIDEEFAKIMTQAIKHLDEINKADLLKFSLAIFQGVSKKKFLCHRDLFINFIQEFKSFFKQIMKSDTSGEYYDEIKQLSIYLIDLRKGSFLLIDIIQYLYIHSKSDQEVIQLIRILYKLSYKATGNLSKAVERLLSLAIENKIQSIYLQPQTHVLLDDVVLKVYYRYKLHFKRPFMDVNQWFFVYFQLLRNKYSEQSCKVSASKKVGFIKHLLQLVNEIPVSTKKREIQSEFYEQVTTYIDRLFVDLNYLEFEENYEKVMDSLSLIGQYKEFIFKNPSICLPSIHSIHSMMVDLYHTFIRERPYVRGTPLSILFIKLVAKYVRVYVLLQNQSTFENKSTNLAHLFNEFQDRRKNIVEDLLQSVYDIILAYQQDNPRNWDSLQLYESVALLCSSAQVRKEQKCKKIIESLVQLFKQKSEDLLYNLGANIKFYLFMKYLGISVPKMGPILNQIALKNPSQVLSEYAVLKLKGDYILQYIKDLSDKKLLRVGEDTVNIILCSLKPEEGELISNQVYQFWFHQQQELFIKLLQDPECWILINIAFRFQFSKTNAIRIDFISEIIRLNYINSKISQKIKEGEKPVLSDFFINEINRIYRDQIAQNSLIFKNNSSNEYKYLILLNTLAQWNLNPKHMILEQNYINFKGIIDYTYFALVDWQNPLYAGIFRTKFLGKLIQGLMKKCFHFRNQDSLNYLGGACLEKIIYWLGSFDLIDEQEWLKKINLYQLMMHMKGKYSKIHTWDILLSMKSIHNEKNNEFLKRMQNMLVNEDNLSYKCSWNKSTVDTFDFKKIYNFLRNSQASEKILHLLTDYQLKMILVHKFIALSGNDHALTLALKRFFFCEIPLTYNQFTIFVSLMIKLIQTERIKDQKLLSAISTWVPIKFCEFSENLTENFLIEYFNLANAFGKINKIEKKMNTYITKLMRKENLDVIQFLYKRKQVIADQIEYFSFLDTLRIKNIMGEYYEVEGTIIKVEIVLIYLYGSIIFQNNSALLTQFVQNFIENADLDFFYAHLQELDPEYFPKLLLRDMIMKRKLPEIKQKTFEAKIVEKYPSLHAVVNEKINQLIRNLSNPQDQIYHLIPGTQIQISHSAIEKIKKYFNPSLFFGKVQLNPYPEEELILIYLATFINSDGTYTVQLAQH